jgi:hypothetical protein
VKNLKNMGWIKKHISELNRDVWAKSNTQPMSMRSVLPKGILKYRVFQKERYNGIPNVTAWRLLRKHLHLTAYKLCIVEGAER